MREFLLFVTSFLFFIFSIPGTNALRYLLAIILLVSTTYIVFQKRDKFLELLSHSAFKRILTLLMIMTVYIFVHNIFISHEIMWSMAAFKGHWVVPVLFFVVGILLATLSQLGNYFNHKSLVTAIFLGMFLHILYIDLVAIHKLIEGGSLITRYGGITTSPVLANYLTNILFAISISELISRYRGHKKVLQVSNDLLYTILILVVFSTFIQGMRHGAITLALTSIVSVFFFMYKNQNCSDNLKRAASIVIVVLMTVPLIHSVNHDERWDSLIETIPIALDTENHLYWQDRTNSIPKLSDGSNVSVSNYERVAWAKKGVEYIVNNPIGIGFGRNAFGHAIQMHEGVDSARGYHAHSSIIDLTIGAGVAWLFLWILIVAHIVLYFFKSFKKDPDFYAITGLLITSGFFFRSVVDSNMRDHVFQQFFLLLGVFLALHVFMQLKNKKSE